MSELYLSKMFVSTSKKQKLEVLQTVLQFQFLYFFLYITSKKW